MQAAKKIEQLEMALKRAEDSHANSRKEIARMQGVISMAEEEKNKAQERLNHYTVRSIKYYVILGPDG